MFVVWAITFLCFVSMSRSAPVDCNDILKPMALLDFHQLQGTWAMVADSLEMTESQHLLPRILSVTITLINSTYIRAVSTGDRCSYDSHNISSDGPKFRVHVPFNYTGIILDTSCRDCVVLSLSLDSPYGQSEELCLFSKRREVEPKELREFFAQAECLNMPKPTVMDPNASLCPGI